MSARAAAAKDTAEGWRLAEARTAAAPWREWGPYVSERSWGTVREDYSGDGDAWRSFTHDDARMRAYRWAEDGIAGICDSHQYLCFALAFWNGRDPILKERLFGLTGPEGNHGEDVKEVYHHLENTPTHSYMHYRYRYPQAEFPYARLIAENAERGRDVPEFELADTGIFAENRYFDIDIEYAKAEPGDLCIRVRAHNRGPDAAPLTLLPTLWYRNRWSWNTGRRPRLEASGHASVAVVHHRLATRHLYVSGEPELLFTENDTNCQRLYGAKNPTPFVKDAFHDYVVHGQRGAVNPARHGTKAAAKVEVLLAAGASTELRLRLTERSLHEEGQPDWQADFDEVFARRKRECAEYYAALTPPGQSPEVADVFQRALWGMLWQKQYYHFSVRDWLRGDAAQPPPPPERTRGRNTDWGHLHTAEILAVPDKWEYPWFATWDLAFHAVTLAVVDPDFAKDQLVVMLREWYQHPNGQLPAYEWNFGDVNPPVHAWAALRVFELDRDAHGQGDRDFLERVFHKLLLAFTWWVNRKDAAGRNLFQGGFLGLDNIGVFNRSEPLPDGGHLDQSDGTSWMAMFTLDMLAIAVELAVDDPVYEDVATKFWEHFAYIAGAMNDRGGTGVGMWDEADGFYYDVLSLPGRGEHPIRVRSMVGLIPLFAIEPLDPNVLHRLRGFRARRDWFTTNRADLTKDLSCMRTPGQEDRLLLALVNAERLKRILSVMLDEAEFLSPYGVRSLSKVHAQAPYSLDLAGRHHQIDYEPGESRTGMFGGNSNWRGPIWLPVNYMLLEALRQFHVYFGDDFQVECPTGSGVLMTLLEVHDHLSERLVRLFVDGRARDPDAFFYEYFHADDGHGLGASHQTGWSGLVANIILDAGQAKRAVGER
ncbi:MAG: glucosidase [Myxococcota bacterium]